MISLHDIGQRRAILFRLPVEMSQAVTFSDPAARGAVLVGSANQMAHQHSPIAG